MNLWTPSPPSRMPQMPAGILFEARVPGGYGGSAIVGGAAADAGGGFKSAANSGKDPSGFQSWVPSACTRVWAFARFSAIQVRSCSALTGPYCWPSFPTILYIVCLYDPVLTEKPAEVTRDPTAACLVARGVLTAPSHPQGPRSQSGWSADAASTLQGRQSHSSLHRSRIARRFAGQSRFPSCRPASH